MLYDEEMMLLAIRQAEKAAAMGEVPVGAVVIDEKGQVIGEGCNCREADNNPLGHAEIIAIQQAAQKKGSWRLSGCTLYVTLEPCPMCAGAIMNARLKRVVYGAFDESWGACASVTRLFDKKFGYTPLVRSRVIEKECGKLMSDFFDKLRK